MTIIKKKEAGNGPFKKINRKNKPSFIQAKTMAPKFEFVREFAASLKSRNLKNFD